MGAARGLRRSSQLARHLKIAVNLSPKQFKSRNLVQTVVNAIVAAGLSPGRLELEITETVLLHDSAATLETLRKLQNFGIRIALDDFGTGYSSLSYLRSFPFDKIKIDRSFINGLSDGSEEAVAIVRAMTQMGLSLGMSTTAEGVETAAQLDIVRAEGCTEVQGYLYSSAQARARDCKDDCRSRRNDRRVCAHCCVRAVAISHLAICVSHSLRNECATKKCRMKREAGIHGRRSGGTSFGRTVGK